MNPRFASVSTYTTKKKTPNPRERKLETRDFIYPYRDSHLISKTKETNPSRQPCH